MSFSSLLGVEFQKLRRSKIGIFLVLPVLLNWIPAVINAELTFKMTGEGISPADNFFIQSFLSFSYFMLPSSLVVMTVLISQTEIKNDGIRKMLSLPVSSARLCLAKFCVLLTLLAAEIALMLGAYFPSARIASRQNHYSFGIDPLYVAKICGVIFMISIPMAAVYWLLSVLLKNPVASVGIGLATVVPIVLFINVKAWFAYPMCYPMMLIASEMGRLSAKAASSSLALTPWIPVAVSIAAAALGISCVRYGKSERK